jgi:hypothetical protein
MPRSPLAAEVSSLGATNTEGTEVADRTSNLDQVGLAGLGPAARVLAPLRAAPLLRARFKPNLPDSEPMMPP